MIWRLWVQSRVGTIFYFALLLQCWQDLAGNFELCKNSIKAFIKSCSIDSRNEQSPTYELVHETNKAHFRNLLPNRFQSSSVGRALGPIYIQRCICVCDITVTLLPNGLQSHLGAMSQQHRFYEV